MPRIFSVIPDLPALARLAVKWQLHDYIYLKFQNERSLIYYFECLPE